jgi:hypothetical protein
VRERPLWCARTPRASFWSALPEFALSACSRRVVRSWVPNRDYGRTQRITRHIEAHESREARVEVVFGRYLRTVRGLSAMPNLIRNSSAIRRQPHDGFSAAILRMSARRSGGTRGRPVGRDFQRQTQPTRSRCQRTSVAGRRTASELRQSKKTHDSITSNSRSKRRARRGRMPRSITMASWRRRNRTSARDAMYAQAVRVPEQRVQDDKKGPRIGRPATTRRTFEKAETQRERNPARTEPRIDRESTSAWPSASQSRALGSIVLRTRFERLPATSVEGHARVRPWFLPRLLLKIDSCVLL